MASLEQYQELVAAMQNLTAEVQALRTENIALRQQMVLHRDEHSDLPAMPLSFGKYDGHPAGLKEFLDACKVNFAFRLHAYETARSQVGLIIANLTGNALSWLTPLVTSNDHSLNDYDRFLEVIKERFDRPEVFYSSLEPILDVKQGNTDVQTYISRFQRLAAKAD
ncbi:protein LDOC1-like [Ambystoma mexicanum]|uniref:protein LDOC1-like n=1 Tax=Ambystoma mexicanum TaxID=8296 RepID=UPI0037E889F0